MSNVIKKTATRISNWLKNPNGKEVKRNPYTPNSAAAIIWNRMRGLGKVKPAPKKPPRLRKVRKPSYDLRTQATTKTSKRS